MSLFNPNFGGEIPIIITRPFISTLTSIPDYIDVASNYTEVEKDRILEALNVMSGFEEYLFSTYDGDIREIKLLFEIDNSELTNPSKQTMLYTFTIVCDASGYESKQEVLDALSDFYDIVRK